MLTRFNILLLVALSLGAVTLVLGQVGWFLTVLSALLVAVGLGVALPQLSLFGPYLCHGNALQQCVTLTFDDGPDPRSTPALLDLLREARVPATFFCLGKRVAAQPELAARIVREGHRLENHSYEHSNLTNFFTVTRLRADLARTQAVIQEATGKVPRCFRPPMGLSNPRVFKVARALGLRVIGWSARGLDTRLTEPKRIVARIIRQLRPGAIVLLHDGNIPAERLVTTVKTLLDTLRTLGYEVVDLDKMLE